MEGCQCGKRAYLGMGKCMACISETVMVEESKDLKFQISNEDRQMKVFLKMSDREQRRILQIASTFDTYTHGINI